MTAQAYTVIIPTLNAAGTLERQLEAVLGQGWRQRKSSSSIPSPLTAPPIWRRLCPASGSSP